MSVKRFVALLVARNKEFFRDKAAVSWLVLFPFLIVIGFSFAFSGPPRAMYKVALIGEAVSAESQSFLQTQYVNFLAPGEIEDPLTKLARHQVDMVFDPQGRYWINSSSPNGYILERILTASNTLSLEKGTVEGREIRYVDWLIAGLLGMNMMFGGLFGVGYTIVRYRKNGVLRRLKVTPVTALEFLMAQVVSRFGVLLASSFVVFTGSLLAVNFQMHGSYLDLTIVLSLGALCLISLGFVIASRIRSEEFAGGMLNLMTWPMMFFSGVWFSLEGTNPMLQRVAQVFPLTHVVAATRAIMTEGATLAMVQGHVFALILMTVVFFIVGSLAFRWE